MFPETLSTRLLKSIGVGLCLLDSASHRILFCNRTFQGWFPDAAPESPVAAVVESLGPEAMEDAIASGQVEIRAKVRRRTLILEARVDRAEHDGRQMLILECQNVSRLRETEAMIDSYAAMVDRRTRDLEREKVQVEKLLLNIMPRTVYEEYRSFGSVAPRLFEPVSVLMLDFVGFTDMAAAADPTVTVAELNDLFTAFDRIGEMHGCERIKTIGDCYLAVAGLPHPNPDHMLSAARCAAKMVRYLEHRNRTHQHKWQARIGLASGSVVGSVVGIQKYIYDVFGPAVNLAARLQDISEPMEITVSGPMIRELEQEFDLACLRTETLRGFGDTQIATMSDRAPTAAVA
ncbi:adenylate/guanylate cyclase domain-containing protein [Chachezhania sediminis]|uniref:adenylate/guanylate cyclase domain-containing protein n=1 Tax=Chachezhania sediminis TaxID=2599291 RepID=UPI00131DCA04|nr:adenylate/guanylate cyclase domain-containing protein [Chachezhania sediminis]